jgi:hypothetical protein
MAPDPSGAKDALDLAKQAPASAANTVGPELQVGRPDAGLTPRSPAAASPPGPRRPGWSRRKKLAVWASVTGALALGVGVGLPLLVEHLGLKAVAGLERRLGVRITAQEVDWSWGGRARVKGLSVTTAAGAPVATAGQVDVDASVDLIERTLALRRIDLRDAALAVTLGADGSSNLDGVIAGLARQTEGDGEGKGTTARLLQGDPPTVRADGVRVVVSVDPSRVPAGLALPPHVGLSGGRFEATPQGEAGGGYAKAVFDVRLAFSDNTLDPGFGFSLSAMAGVEAGVGRVGLEFARPLRLRVGDRVAAVGALGYDGGQRVVVARGVQLSERLPDGPAPASVTAAFELGRVTAGPMELPRLLKLARGGLAGLESAIAGIERVTLESPAAVLDLDAPWLGFGDLPERLGLVASGAPAAPREPAPLEPPRKGAAPKDGPPKDGLKEALASRLGQLLDRVGRLAERIWNGVDRRLARGPRLVVTGGRIEVRGGGAAVELSDLGLEIERETDGVRARFATRLGAPGAAEALRVARATPAEGPKAVDPRGAVALELSHLTRGEAGAGSLLAASFEAREVSGGWLAPLLGGGEDGKARPVALAPEGRVHHARVTFDAAWGRADGAAPDAGGEPGETLARWEAAGQVALSGLTLDVPGLSATPLTGLDGAVEGRLIHRPEDRLLSLEGLRVSRGGVTVTGRADVADATRSPRVKLALSLPPVDVQRLFDAIPPELVPALRGLRVKGTLGWELAVDLDSANPAKLKDQGLDSRPTLTGFEVESMGEVIDFNALKDQHTYAIRASDGSETTRLVGPNASGWVPLGGISPFVAKALNTTEDGTFWSNDGVAPFAMRESLVANLERGAFVRGGSTITQQLVKNLYLGGQKLIGRKLQELFIAWRMTEALSKQEIMELYLNTIEFAPGVYGIGSAAYHWFGKRPADLSLPEAVFLASIVPAPRRYHSFYAAGGISEKWRAYLGSLLAIMVRRGHVSAEDVAALGDWQLTFRSTARPAATGGVYDQLPEPDAGEEWDGDLLNQPR